MASPQNRLWESHTHTQSSSCGIFVFYLEVMQSTKSHQDKFLVCAFKLYLVSDTRVLYTHVCYKCDGPKHTDLFCHSWSVLGRHRKVFKTFQTYPERPWFNWTLLGGGLWWKGCWYREPWQQTVNGTEVLISLLQIRTKLGCCDCATGGCPLMEIKSQIASWICNVEKTICANSWHTNSTFTDSFAWIQSLLVCRHGNSLCFILGEAN